MVMSPANPLRPRDDKAHQPRDGRDMENLRDRSCRDLCSLLLNARLQNWHLYLFSFSFSGAEALRLLVGDAASDSGWRALATVDMAEKACAGCGGGVAVNLSQRLG